jgi:hypothetical protein
MTSPRAPGGRVDVVPVQGGDQVLLGLQLALEAVVGFQHHLFALSHPRGRRQVAVEGEEQVVS